MDLADDSLLSHLWSFSVGRGVFLVLVGVGFMGCFWLCIGGGVWCTGGLWYLLCLLVLLRIFQMIFRVSCCVCFLCSCLIMNDIESICIFVVSLLFRLTIKLCRRDMRLY